MIRSRNLKTAYSRENLHRAWRWLQTSSDAHYKEYFRHTYAAFSGSADQLIKGLHKRLNDGTYEPSTPTKIFFPKKSGTLRMYTLLSVEDQIVYQALANIVAEKVTPKVSHRYRKSIFGYLYDGKNSFQFYQDWKESYRRFTSSFVKAHSQGYDWIASFDLTAFYDSIDHKVLHHQLCKFRLDKEFSDTLIALLGKWTESQELKQPIHHGHGIPQGPLSSGIIAETLLSRFDGLFEGKTQIKYLRYVDDIRLLGASEKVVRHELIRLDLVSKALGLFPQSGKIDLHKITDIQKEIKSVSTVEPDDTLAPNARQRFLVKNFNAQTIRLKIHDETKVKFLLPQIKPNANTTKKVIKLLNLYPHLYKTFIGYLSRIRKFSAPTSKSLIEILESNEVYFSFSAALIGLLRDRHHHHSRQRLIKICKKRLTRTSIGYRNAELRASASSLLLKHNGSNWTELQNLLTWPEDWWVRSYIQKYLEVSKHGVPNSTAILNDLLGDEFQDPAIVAADTLILSQLSVTKPRATINDSAQIVLKHQKIIQRLSRRNCFVSDCFKRVANIQAPAGKWRRFLGVNYDLTLTKMPRWKAAMGADSTTWVCLTDTINDIILEELCRVDGQIGSYKMGNIGGFIYAQNSKFAKKYPQLQKAMVTIHDLRLKADLSHPIVKQTGELTRYITSKEGKNARRLFSIGLSEMWRQISNLV